MTTCKSRLGISVRTKRQQKGSSMVEAGLVGVILLVTVFGIMDFGRALWSYTLVSHGAREATRYAMVHGNSSGNTASVDKIKGIVTGQTPGLDSTNLVTTVTFNPNQNAGSTVRVKVTYSFSPLAPFIPVGPLTLQSTSQMVIIQ